MNKKIKSILVLILISLTVFAADGVPKPPNPSRIVNDYAGFLSREEIRMLENKLVRFDSENSSQIAIVILSDLNGYEPNEMATRIMEEWGIGQKGKDNGIVILVKPKTFDSQGQVFISTGYGVEEFVTDALAKQIVDYDIIPQFKEGRFFEGLDKATDTLISLLTGEFTGTQYLEKQKQKDGLGGIVPFLLIFIILPLIFGGRRRHNSLGGSLPFWLMLGMMNGGRGSSGGFGGFSSGGGSFGGFGGGMGGGGGAGGSW